MSVSTRYLDPIELNPEGQSRKDWFLIDVRTPAEFREAHIEGSQNLPLADLAENLESVQTYQRQSPVALVCRTSRRAKEGAKLLENAGVSDVAVLDGGVVAWEELGYSLVRGKKAMSLERQVRVAAGSLVLIGVLLGIFLHPGFFGLSGFVGAGLVFAGLTDTCGMAMLLGRMPWNRAPKSCARGPMT